MFLNTFILYLYIILFNIIFDKKSLSFLKIDYIYTYRGIIYKLIDPLLILFIFNITPMFTLSVLFLVNIISYFSVDYMISVSKLKYLIVTKQIYKIKERN